MLLFYNTFLFALSLALVAPTSDQGNSVQILFRHYDQFSEKSAIPFQYNTQSQVVDQIFSNVHIFTASDLPQTDVKESNQKTVQRLPKRMSFRFANQSTEASLQVRQTGSCLAGDKCQSDSECLGSRKCINTQQDSPPFEKCNTSDCSCAPDTFSGAILCTDDEDCDEGEGCFGAEDFSDTTESYGKICFSRAAKADIEIGCACIATRSLQHFPRENLVFEKDVIANVFCDTKESCATPGHIVLYRGKAMMMKRYCELTGCVQKVMMVNSPRYRRRMKVRSQSEQLEFTVFAARYETHAEETMLSIAVKLGF